MAGAAAWHTIVGRWLGLHLVDSGSIVRFVNGKFGAWQHGSIIA